MISFILIIGNYYFVSNNYTIYIFIFKTYKMKIICIDNLSYFIKFILLNDI